MPHTTPKFDPPLHSCPMCVSPAIRAYDSDFNGINIFRCRDCELLFMNPQYSEAYLTELYSAYIPPTAPDNSDFNERRRAAKADDMDFIESAVRPGKLLSIGCGDGIELEIARDRGWQIEGFDIDEPTVRRVSARLKTPIRQGDFFELDWPLNHYDCVFMDQVLEHPRNPQDYLAKVFRLLRPGGVLFIGCPNIDSISNQYKGLMGRMGLKGSRRGKHYETFHHLFYYSPRVLANIMQVHFGYETVAIEGDPLTGPKSFRSNSTWLSQPLHTLRRKFPVLESTFRLLARKPAASARYARAA